MRFRRGVILGYFSEEGFYLSRLLIRHLYLVEAIHTLHPIVVHASAIVVADQDRQHCTATVGACHRVVSGFSYRILPPWKPHFPVQTGNGQASSAGWLRGTFGEERPKGRQLPYAQAVLVDLCQKTVQRRSASGAATVKHSRWVFLQPVP